MRMYAELASWWPLVSSPEEYREEADEYRRLLSDAVEPPPRTVLELGSGGGNNASHLKSSFAMTLVDGSEQMLNVSRALNPDCEHVGGDMRTVRLHREFDAVFIHDAVDYMTSIPDLEAAMRTAFVHCRPGGAVLLCPDHTRETFAEGASAGGSDGDGCGLRYLEWTFDPDPSDSTYIADYTFVLRDASGATSVEHDRHVCGLFSRTEWLTALEAAGFDPQVVEGTPATASTLFLGRRLV